MKTLALLWVISPDFLSDHSIILVEYSFLIMKTEPVITIGYADDHVSIRQGIIAYLKSLGGIDVLVEADNGAELVKSLSHLSLLPNIIILDINMPVMDGFETISILSEKWPQIKTLILTAFDTELYLIRMIKMGANGYLLKSCHPQEIKQAIVTIYNNDYYYHDAQSKSFHNKVKTGIITLPHFTDNEMLFLKYCPMDLSYDQIATKMNITVKAIDGYRDRLCIKLKVKGRIGLAMAAIQFGFAQVDTKSKQDIFILHNKK